MHYHLLGGQGTYSFFLKLNTLIGELMRPSCSCFNLRRRVFPPLVTMALSRLRKGGSNAFHKPGKILWLKFFCDYYEYILCHYSDDVIVVGLDEIEENMRVSAKDKEAAQRDDDDP